MSLPVGIGIITYNRREILGDTIERVRTLTRQPGAVLVVADDGSTDGTLTMLREQQVPFITGTNMGIAWNKNRALFLLSHMLECKTVILLEDDTKPVQIAWEAEWIEAARRWGHVNYAGDWMQPYILSGTGTVADPARSKMITAQCAAYSREALTYGGFFDTRFRGYGHEHVEHSRRLLRGGYGGTDERIDGQEIVIYHLLRSHLDVVDVPSFRDVEQEETNFKLATAIMGQEGYRAPWRADSELYQFRSEIESAMIEGHGRFCLSLPQFRASHPVGRGILSRLFRLA